MKKMTVAPLMMAVMMASLALTGCNKTIKGESKNPSRLVALSASEADLQPIFSVNVGDGRSIHPKDVLDLQIGFGGDTMVIASKSGMVQGFEKGLPTWTTPIGEPIVSGVAFDVSSQTAIVGTNTGKVVALDGETGKVRWVQNLGTTVLTPAVIAGNRVLLSANNGVLHGLNLQSGASIWQFGTSQPKISVRGTAKPLRLDGETALFGTADGRIHALSSDSGRPLWTRRVGGDVGRLSDVDGTPLVVGNFLYVSSFSGQLVGFDMSTGQTLFTVRDFASTRPLAHLNGVLIGTDNDGVVHAFHPTTGKRLWQNTDLRHRKLSAPAVVGRFVAFGDYEGVVHLFDRNGNIVARQSLKNKGRIVSLHAHQNRLYTQSADGQASVWQVQ